MSYHDPLPPSRAESATMDAAESVAFELTHSISNTAWRVSHALSALHNHAFSRSEPRIPPHSRRAVLAGLALAHEPIMGLFTTTRDRAIASLAFDATVRMVDLWAGEDVGDTDEGFRIHSLVRWLRNECHNASILQQLGLADPG